jgi:hypothetical protein
MQDPFEEGQRIARQFRWVLRSLPWLLLIAMLFSLMAAPGLRFLFSKLS